MLRRHFENFFVLFGGPGNRSHLEEGVAQGEMDLRGLRTGAQRFLHPVHHLFIAARLVEHPGQGHGGVGVLGVRRSRLAQRRFRLLPLSPGRQRAGEPLLGFPGDGVEGQCLAEHLRRLVGPSLPGQRLAESGEGFVGVGIKIDHLSENPGRFVEQALSEQSAAEIQQHFGTSRPLGQYQFEVGGRAGIVAGLHSGVSPVKQGREISRVRRQHLVVFHHRLGEFSPTRTFRGHSVKVAEKAATPAGVPGVPGGPGAPVPASAPAAKPAG